MTMVPCVEEVRQIVVRNFVEFGAEVRYLSDLTETILVEDGRAMARSYRSADLMAMWLLSVGVVQFYDAEGNMLRTLNLLAEMVPQRVAA
jgi:hypothetical protein